MYFLLSGEGLTDIGTDKGAATICEGNDFVVGPMAMIVSKIVECKHDYSIFDGACGFISERNVAKRAIELKSAKKKAVFARKEAVERNALFLQQRPNSGTICKRTIRSPE